MTSGEFIAWAMRQPETERYELFGGEVLPMAPERSAHALARFKIARQSANQIEAGSLPCQAYPDGRAVEVDDDTACEPDALVAAAQCRQAD